MLPSFVVVSFAIALGFLLVACGESSSEPWKSAAPGSATPGSAAPGSAASGEAAARSSEPNLLDFTMNSIDGKPVHLADYAGKVVLFVNVASKCGYTKQYPALESLHQKYKDQGFVLIGVPANNFGGQEPGSNEQIAQFCSRTYGVTFPMLAKVSVTGDDICPLYRALIAAADAGALPETGPVKWNFEKFLLDRSGKLVARFRSAVTPDSAQLTDAIEEAMKAN
ncbi:MAG: glutathione peroxidase [Phycisphaeraceae bacterium]